MTKKTDRRSGEERRSGKDRRELDVDLPANRERRHSVEPRKIEVTEVKLPPGEWEAICQSYLEHKHGQPDTAEPPAEDDAKAQKPAG